MALAYELFELQDLTAQVVLVVLRALDTPLRYQAGQYTCLHLKGHKGFYCSLAGTPEASPHLHFHIKTTSRHSRNFLKHLKEQSFVLVDEAEGICTLDRALEDDIVLAAGGVGFAPIYGLLQSLCLQKKNLSVELFWGNNTKQDFYFLERLDDLKQKLNLTVHLLLATDRNVQKPYLAGFIGENIIQTTSLNHKIIFASGPLKMIQEVFHCVITQDFSKEKFFSDAKELLTEPCSSSKT